MSSLQQQVPKKKSENEPIKKAVAVPKQSEPKDLAEDQRIEEGFQIQETRAQKKERIKQEQQESLYKEAAENVKKGLGRGRGRGRVRGQMTFIPQQKRSKVPDPAKQTVAEMMDQQYNEM